jgi:hypothetical protein
LSLEDGESVKIVRLNDIKAIVKAGFGGEEKEVLRLVCDVQTSEGVNEKSFDNGTMKFAQELQVKGVKIGSGFTLTRNGLQTKTKYTISGVSQPEATPTSPTAGAATPTPASVTPANPLKEAEQVSFPV